MATKSDKKILIINKKKMAEAKANAVTLTITEAAPADAAPAEAAPAKAAPADAVILPVAGGAGAAAPECNICCDLFNNSSRKCVECEYVNCKYKACVTCVRAYLLTSTNEPHCMECKQAWTPKFMLVLTKKWLSETYKPHKEKFLCDIELSKLPETMPAAERYKNVEKEKKVRRDLNEKIKQLKNEIATLNNQIDSSYRRERGSNDAAIVNERKVFFMSCPAATCNGMLSTQYKCGICEMYACPACHEIIGPRKTDAHTCDPNNVASAEAIKKETKQCPGCHNRIYRIEGCSQMWCTGCHTAFDWNTGRKVQGDRLHNPHWLEYQRSQNAVGQAQRAPGDVPCGGLVGRRDVLIMTQHLPKAEFALSFGKMVLGPLYALVTDITNNQVRDLRRHCQIMRDFERQRIEYIVGEKSKDDLAKYIYRSDRKVQKMTELLYIYELLSAVGVDMFNRMTQNNNLYSSEELLELIKKQVEEYDALRLHCNGLFAVISNTYGQVVPQIDEKWILTSGRFNSKGKGAMLSSTP
jgi:prefoldin subunit 5